MSAKLFGRGLETAMPSHVTKLVLLKLLDACEPDGTRIFPGMTSISRAAMVSERQAQRVMRLFSTVGLLVLVEKGGRGPGDTAQYRLDLGKFDLLVAQGWDATFGPVGDALRGVNKKATMGDVAAPIAKGDISEPKGEAAVPKGEAQTSPDPSVDPSLDPLRESARTSREGRPSLTFLPPDDGPREIAFQRFLKPRSEGGFPPEAIDDVERARTAWADVPEVEWDDAVEAVPRFLHARKTTGRGTLIGLEKYIRDRHWQRFPRPVKPDGTVAAEPTLQLGPFCRELWCLLWKAVSDAQRSGEERYFRRVSDRLGHVAKGLLTPASAIPTSEDLIALVPIVVGSDEHEAWTVYCQRIGFAMPRPDVAAVVYTPSRMPPALRSGWKAYRLAKPAPCAFRSRTWWWRLHQIEDRQVIEAQLREGGRSAGNATVEFGPWPATADLADMIEVKQGSDAWHSWAKYFDSKGIYLTWPEPSIWCPSEYPAGMASGLQNEGEAA